MAKTTRTVELRAYEIVRQEEVDRGWTPGPLFSQSQQPKEGCDFLSTPPGGGEPDRVEVKGWGEPLFTTKGRFTYRQDINVEQYDTARNDPRWRLEVVANLTTVIAGTGFPERLTLRGAEAVHHARRGGYWVTLDAFAGRATAQTILGLAREAVRGYGTRNLAGPVMEALQQAVAASPTAARAASLEARAHRLHLQESPTGEDVIWVDAEPAITVAAGRERITLGVPDESRHHVALRWDSEWGGESHPPPSQPAEPLRHLD